MEKRILLFVVSTMLVLFVMQWMQPRPQAPVPGAMSNAAAPVASAPRTQETQPAAQPHATAPVFKQEAAPVQGDNAAERLVRVETDLYKAVFSHRGGTLKSFELKQFRAEDGSPVVLLKEGARMRTLALGVQDDYSISGRPFDVEGSDMKLTMEDQTGTLVFRYTGENFNIRRLYTFSSGTYTFELEDTVEGLPHYQLSLGSEFGMFEPEGRYLHTGPVLLSMNDREEFKPGKVDAPESFNAPIHWIAVEDKYFTGAAVMRTPMVAAVVWPDGPDTAIGVRGAPGTHKITIYGGPKERGRLKGVVGGRLHEIVYFGWFSPIAIPIFSFLQWIYSIVGNYGFAIIILTILIRVPFIPLVNKGQKSMKKLQELQPRMAELKKQYKNDPDRMNKEMMGLYSKHKVNPVGGCLPLVLQIPVFFALYKVLMVTVELRGAPFAGWITDLAMPDPVYVLPVVMGATMFLQQKMTPTGGDERMKKVLMWMPIVFTFISLSFPSGLVLYWMVNNLLSIAQQYFVNKAKDPEAAAQAK